MQAMYAESYEMTADLAGLGSVLSQEQTGCALVAKREREFAATRSSSDLPQDKQHAVSGFGDGMSKHDC